MADKNKILAICGSIRKSSSNLNLIRSISDLTSDTFIIKIFDALSEIPPFNPDLDDDHPPKPVADFRKEIGKADGILICSPEYAMGVPGVLKNALDWTVTSMDFSTKPVALITASLSGEKAHASLLETLSVIEARIIPATSLLIPFIKTKVNSENKITDDTTLLDVTALSEAFDHLITGKEQVHH